MTQHSEHELAIIRESQEHWAKRATLQALEQGIHGAEMFLEVYPDTLVVAQQIEVNRAELETRTLSWLEERMPHGN
jgi:hypothetical protein